jgi:hypothetical protein
MIIWINGAFGVGKTHTSYELVRRIDNTFLFDPEKIGFFLRKQLPNTSQYDDFQKIPLWRIQVLESLIYCAKSNVITVVPMTIVDDDIFDFIIGGLRENMIDVRHFALVASRETVEKRLTKRGDKNSWNFKQVERCLNSLSKTKYKTHIDTDKHNLDEVVEFIANKTGLSISKNRLNWISKQMNWFIVSLKNIR